MTPFVGRRAELAQLHAWLVDPAVRLITLSGPGGVGKSRLARQALSGLPDAFPDGVYTVDLTAVTERALALDLIAQAVGAPETPGAERAAQLATQLAHQRVLVLLDNCDRLDAPAVLLGDLLAAAPRSTVLVTQRTPFRRNGDYELRVAPLAVPPLGMPLTFGDLPAWDALQLFVALVRAATPAFAPSTTDLTALAALAHRLDGIPLALELAASQIGLLGPQAVLERLEGTKAAASERYEALDAAIAWSYTNLEPAVQDLLRRLTVFRGGAALQAIEVICAPEEHQSVALLDALGALLERHLARRLNTEQQGLRVGLLETIQRFGYAQLLARGEARLAQRRHAEYFLAYAERSAARLGGPEHAAALEQLEAEHGNLRAALAWGMQPDGDALLALRLVAALARFWAVRGHLREGRAWLDQIVCDTAAPPAFAAAQPPAFRAARAQAVLAAAQLAHHQRDQSASSALFGEALELCRTLDLPSGEAHALRGLGNNAVEAGWFVDARSYYEASLTLAQRLGAAPQIGSLLNNLGLVALYENEYTRAAELMQRSLVLYRRLGDTDRTSALLSNLGLVALRAGEAAAAAQYFGESLQLAVGLHDAWGVAHTLGRIAELALVCDHPERAAWLLGAAEQYPGYSAMLDNVDTLAHSALLARLDLALGAANRAAHQEAGYAADRETMVEQAQALCAAWAAGER